MGPRFIPLNTLPVDGIIKNKGVMSPGSHPGIVTTWTLASSDKSSNWLKREMCIEFLGNFIFAVSSIPFLLCYLFSFCHPQDQDPGLRNPSVSVSATKSTLQ